MDINKRVLLCVLFFLNVCNVISEVVDYSDIDFYKSPSSDILPFVERVKRDAEKGNAEAQLKLSVLYSRGIGVEKSPVNSGLWLRRSADNKNAQANYFLGYKYLFGFGVPKDIKEAIKRFEFSASEGDERSTQILGVIRYGMYGLQFIDLNKSLKYLRKSSDKGNSLASFLLSCIYRYDMINKDFSNKYMELSIVQGGRIAAQYTVNKDREYLKKQCKSHRATYK